jgi:hypothetical protein
MVFWLRPLVGSRVEPFHWYILCSAVVVSVGAVLYRHQSASEDDTTPADEAKAKGPDLESNPRGSVNADEACSVVAHARPSMQPAGGSEPGQPCGERAPLLPSAAGARSSAS